MTLTDNVHVLTRAHLTNDNGTLRHAPALLGELRAAVTPQHTGGASGSAGGPPIPINPNALDLIGEIEKEARKDYAEAVGHVWNGELEALLQSYPDSQISAEWEAYLARVSLEWIDTITALLWPGKPRRKLVGKACPSCGQSVYGEERKTTLSLGCWDSEGNMKKIGDWDIECAACEAGWAGERVAWLLRATGDTPGNQELVHMG